MTTVKMTMIVSFCEDCEEKNFISDDITLLEARSATALRLRTNIKSVAMLNEKKVIYKTVESKITFENQFKLFEWDQNFIHPNCKTS